MQKWPEPKRGTGFRAHAPVKHSPESLDNLFPK